MNQVRLGIVGLGNIFEKEIDALMEEKRFAISAICDTNIDNLNKYKWLCENCFTNYESILNDCDVVLINTPPALHLKIANFFVENGKDIIVEKPLTANLDELKQLQVLIDNHKNINVYSLLHSAFGKEILWWNKNSPISDLPNKIIAIFDDPYYVDGTIPKHAIGLGGAYIDSTINCLSAINGLYPGKFDCFKVEKKMIQEAGIDYLGKSYYTLNYSDKDIEVEITINWKCDKKDKHIDLFFDNGQVYRLDGHEQFVKNLISGEQLFKADGGRMYNQYGEMFKDYFSGKNNIEKGMELQKIIFCGEQSNKFNN